MKLFTLSAMAVAMSVSATVWAAPAVEMEVITATSSEHVLRFTPNEDCAQYYVCQFDHGTLEQQFAMWSAFMGFQSEADMVKAWGGKATTTVDDKTWNNLAPNTTYDYYVASYDADGNVGELQCFEVATLGKGGEGVAEISIEIGTFQSWVIEGETVYSQQVIYSPNDQTALFFDMICTQEWYQENGQEGCIALMKEDEFRPNAWYYIHYDVDDASWNAEYATVYHALAIGRNALDEWGPCADVIFATEGAEVPVGIQQVHRNSGTTTIYNLQGQKVRTINGIVIKDGRTIIVK